MNPAEAQTRIIARFRQKSQRIDRSLYRLANGNHILFRTSKAHRVGVNKLLYWFGFDQNRLDVQDKSSLFIAYVCGSENQTIFIPALRMLEMLGGVEVVSDNNWKIKIYETNGKFELALTGKPYFDVTENLNRLDLADESVIGRIREASVTTEKYVAEEDVNTEISVEEEIAILDGVEGNSLHDKLIDMLRQIGDWMGYEAVREYAIRPDVPYRLDVAWILNDAIHVAIEVQISGNVTEAKDRLLLARRFGARKLIIVSSPDHVDRIKAVFRYETDIKHWLEIWGVESIYNMFVDGRNFFESYRKFNKHEFREDITEMVSIAQ